MSVGLRLCALEFTSKQLKVLAHLSVSRLLPDGFPHARWVMAVQKSFCTQEIFFCAQPNERLSIVGHLDPSHDENKPSRHRISMS